MVQTIIVSGPLSGGQITQGMGLLNLDRVEVLRGPQGTLFGRNTTGGAINFITRAPGLEGSNGYLLAGYGNFDTYHLQGAAEVTMVEDELGLRVAANYGRGGGQFKNIFPGAKDPASTNTLQGRATLRARPGGGPLDIKIVVYGGRYNPTQQAVFGPEGDRFGLGFFEVNSNRVGNAKSETYGVMADIAYEITDQLKVTSISSADGGALKFGVFDADGSPRDLLQVPVQSRFAQESEELRLNYSSPGIDLVVGGFYGRDATTTTNIFNLAIGPGLNGGFHQHYYQVRKFTAAFAQGDFKVTDAFTVTVGARYTWDRSLYRDGYAYLFAGNIGEPEIPLATTVPCPGLPGTCAYDPGARYQIRGRNKALTGRVALSYAFSESALLYASYNRGYRSGAFNGGGYTSSSGITYIRPEKVNAYDAGLKGELWGRKLTYALAGFYYDYSNQQLQDLRPGPVSFLVSSPKSEIYGGELEIGWRITPTLRLSASGGLLHATYKELTLSNTDLSGNRLPFAPKATAQASLDWDIAELGGGELTLSPAVNYTSRQYFSPYNKIDPVGSPSQNSLLQQKAFAKVNGSLSWRSSALQVRAWVENLTNRKTLAYGLDFLGAGLGFEYLVPASPRTYGVELRYNF